jgi:hypothetical protein
MLGLNEAQLFSMMDEGSASASSRTAKNIESQGSLEPRDILIRLTNSVAKAIEANNKVIEEQLRNAGIKL